MDPLLAWDRGPDPRPYWPAFRATLATMIGTRAAEFAQQPLIVEGGKTATYADINARSAAIGLGLRAAGIGKGERVGIWLGDGAEWIATFFGIARIGAVAVPLSTMYQPSELTIVAQSADLAALIACRTYRGKDYVERIVNAFPGIGKPLRSLAVPNAPNLRMIWIAGDEAPEWATGTLDDLIAAGTDFPTPLADIEAQVAPSDPALIIFTSGSTADPKGVIHTNATAVRHSAAVPKRQMGFGPGDRLWTPYPLFWVGGLNVCLLAAMQSGAALIIANSRDPEAIMNEVERTGATHISGWPTLMAEVRGHPAYSDERFRYLKRGFGRGDHAQVVIPLGMTESFGPHSFEPAGTVLEPKRAGSCGRAAPGMERRIVDPETGETMRRGEYGELWLRGYAMTVGLCGKERSEIFTEDGFFRTGDICSIDEAGYLYFNGRLGDMIKCRGVNISPGEVERVLLGFPEVQEVAVFGIPDRVSEEIPVAVLVLKPGQEIGEAELEARTRQALSAYKVPQLWYFWDVADMPRLTTSKPDRKRLRDQIIAARAQSAAA